MAKPNDIKVTLKGVHREQLKGISDRTGLSFNQIVNHLYANGAAILKALEAAHTPAERRR